MLLGQPELRDVLARPDLAQLAQRITARYHLAPLDPHETETYLRHRLAVAGSKRFPFAMSAVRALHARAGGVPRRINIIADRALTGAYAQQASEIGVELVQRAADEALGESSAHRRPWFALVVGALLIAAVLGLAWTTSQSGPGQVPAGSVADSTSPAPTASTARINSDAAASGLRVPRRAPATDVRGPDSSIHWYFPPELPATLAQGAQGASVEWLERALAAVRVPIDPAHVAGRYDASLMAAVRMAQRQFGLREDGVAGRETQWVLASRAAAAAAKIALPQTAGELASPSGPLDSAPSPSR